jgi:hypothetical protein
MAAEKGNKYAEKITREKALEVAQQALDAIDDECFFLDDICDKIGIYRDKFYYILEKFEDDEEITDLLKRAKGRSAAFIQKKAAKGKDVNPVFGIFVLKSVHGFVETSKVENDVNLKSDLSSLYKKALSSNENETGRS